MGVQSTTCKSAEFVGVSAVCGKDERMSTNLYTDPTHNEMKSLIKMHLSGLTACIKLEEKLPNGRIADVVIDTIGGRIIVEVKPFVKYAYLASAYGKYYGQANAVYLASPMPRYIDEKVSDLLGWSSAAVATVGILCVGWDGLTIVRPATYHLLP